MSTNLKREKIITDITSRVTKQVKQTSESTLKCFIRQYLHLLAYEDLCEHSVEEFSALVLSHWQFIQGRAPHQSKVRVYNPTLKEHGWQSSHTIVEISHDDMPFLVDSIRMAINRHGLGVHFIIHVGGMKLLRDKKNNVTEILPWGEESITPYLTDAPIHVEVDKKTDPAFLLSLQKNIENVLSDVTLAVEDWRAIQSKVYESVESLESNPPKLDQTEIEEAKDFLRWLVDNNFTFLGYRDYELVGTGDKRSLKIVPHSSLGVLRDDSSSLEYRYFSEMTSEAKAHLLSSDILIVAKTNTESTVHRPIYTDYIGVKRFNKAGQLIGERRFIGLFTTTAYSAHPENIPFLRLKVKKILEDSKLIKNSHAYKALKTILETFPRNDLFHTNVDELSDIVMGIFNLQERNHIRLFIRKDVYGRYFSCLVYVPKVRFNNDLEVKIKNILEAHLKGKESETNTYFGDSVLARIHYIIRVQSKRKMSYDIEKIEKGIVYAAADWQDHLQEVLSAKNGEEHARVLFEKYRYAFPAGYREVISSAMAVQDIHYLESLNANKLLELNFYEIERDSHKEFNLKIYQSTNALSLSEVMPVLENMGMRVLGEHPYEIKLSQGGARWITEFSMQSVSHVIPDVQKIKQLFESAFEAIWLEQAENDGFNKLVTLSELTWRKIVVIRAMARYLRQIGVSYNQEYIEKVFIAYPLAAKLLFDYFELRFNPQKNLLREEQLSEVEKQFVQLLESVSSLDEDKVLRAYLSLLKGMIRTNYYQLNNTAFKHYISFKFDSSMLDLPKPKPMFEVFVYSVRFEAIHLRGGKVARGGIRWSDRRDDFRTEVLGLMKAQQVKNSVIVPTGAKGGFILKKANNLKTREAFMAEGISCYKDFIRGLLDITDNYKGKEVVSPLNVVKYDDVDPYLVVAADKGTATFSDFANSVSEEYNFWLADAFASGGKTGYDHKKMAITARGGWVSVTRHFQMLGVDIQNTDFTVAGIGDMAGDVFGNGMLLSRHIKLVAAFNHQHIFIDPNPNAEKSFIERGRLFNLPRSSWEDYQAKLISKGGGIFSRDLKSIKLTHEMKKLLDLYQEAIAPNDLINAILKMRVDLLWNGGIGTYVKASYELDSMAGDRANDAVRINGNELRCRVVGEGGNLGFTQAGRVEYALNGGSIYTDFIDNSGGVDCSDKEVNIKILLNEIVSRGNLTMTARNKLLKDMTDEVGHLVLHDNYRQTQAIEIASYQAVEQIDLYNRFTSLLEEKGIIDRKLESLPSIDEFLNRKVSGKGLTPPEIAVLLSYSKLFLKKRLLSSNVTEDKYLARYLFTAFPKRLVTKFEKDLTGHRLSREIIITQLSNDIVNEMGPVFVYRIYHETGANYVDIARAYVIARDIFGMSDLWKSIQSLDAKVSEEIKIKMMILVTKLIRRATRWFIRRYHQDLDIVALLKTYKENVGKASKILPSILLGERKEHFDKTVSEFLEAGVPQELAVQVAATDPLFSLLDILNHTQVKQSDLKNVLTIYYSLSEELKLSWLRYQIRGQKNETYWDDLALVGVLDDVDRLQAKLMTSAMSYSGKNNSEKIEAWRQANQRLLSRWLKTIVAMRKNINLSMVMLFVALHDLIDFSNACASQKSKGKK